MDPERDFEMTDADFAQIRSIIRVRVGIDLGEAKRALVYGRLVRRLRHHGLERFSDYLLRVQAPGSEEEGPFINALTTNVTEFFRENHHFEYLTRTVLPALRAGTNGRRLRFWSAGCSTGEEPYSLAMTIREAFPESSGWDIRVLATDIDSDVLGEATEGIYAADRIERIPGPLVSRYWTKSGPGRAGGFVAGPAIRSLITFKQLNLLGPWPMRGPFDVIFCRNVIIYFDGPTKLGLVKRFQGLLRPGGHLFLGHSESMVGAGLGLASCGRTAYRKDGPASEAA
jgi:chemotaxis protein methyltransferase CheR